MHAQAISVIVTHRTDDMSKLPPVHAPDQVAKPKQATQAARPKLALMSAKHRGGKSLSEEEAGAVAKVEADVVAQADVAAGAVAAPRVPDFKPTEQSLAAMAVESPPVTPAEGALADTHLHPSPITQRQSMQVGA